MAGIRGHIGLWVNKGGSSGEYNVLAYGAKGDASTNDTVAIQAANDAANVNGGFVTFPEGTYIVDDLAFSSNVRIYSMGGLLSINSGKTVTITGLIENKNNQLFTGNGVVSFTGNTIIENIYPQWWGAVGDNSTDCTASIQKCLDAAATNNVCVTFPFGIYRFSDTLNISGKIKKIDMSAATMIYTADVTTYKTAIYIGYDGNRPVFSTYIGLNVTRNSVSNWLDEADIGICVLNSYNCYFHDITVRYFCIGLRMISDPTISAAMGEAYNNIFLNILQACKVGVDLINGPDDGSYVGFTNQNIFYNGRFSGSTATAHNTMDRYGVRISSDVSSTYTGMNNNIFIAPCFELQESHTTGEAVGILIKGTSSQNIVFRARNEFNDYVAKFEDDTHDNTVEVAYGYATYLDESSLTGSNLVTSTLGEYLKNLVIPIFQSSSLKDVAMYDGDYVTMPVPIFATRYNSISRSFRSLYLKMTENGIEYSSGTQLGIGVRINTSIQKHFRISHHGSTLRYYIVCYDADMNHLSADSGTYCWSTSSANSLTTSANFVSSGKSYTTATDTVSSSVFKLSNDVYFIDVIYAITSAKYINSFSIYALNCLYSPPVVPIYSTAPNGSCQGTAVPNKYWKSYPVGTKLYNYSPVAGGNAGWICVNQKDTTLSGAEATGQTILSVTDNATMAVNDKCMVMMDSGEIHPSYITNVGVGEITINDALTGDCASGNAVYTFRFESFGAINLQGSITWNPASLVDGAGETSPDIAVTGAALGDFVLVSAPYDLQGITCNGYVKATNTVVIRIQNETTGTIDLASGTWKVKVIKA